MVYLIHGGRHKNMYPGPWYEYSGPEIL